MIEMAFKGDFFATERVKKTIESKGIDVWGGKKPNTWICRDTDKVEFEDIDGLTFATIEGSALGGVSYQELKDMLDKVHDLQNQYFGIVDMDIATYVADSVGNFTVRVGSKYVYFDTNCTQLQCVERLELVEQAILERTKADNGQPTGEI